MTGTELRDLFLSPEFKQGLQELSSYLASIMQERPIVYLLAKCLWMKGIEFDLEDKRHDLTLDGKRIEFKFNYDRCDKARKRESQEHGGDIKAISAGRRGNRAIVPKIYKDVCKRSLIFSFG